MVVDPEKALDKVAKRIEHSFAYALSSLYVILIMVYSLLVFTPRDRFTAVMLPLSIAIMFLNRKDKRTGNIFRLSIKGLICSFLLFAFIYFWIEFDPIVTERVGNYTNLDYFISASIIVLVLWIMFRWMGVVFGSIITLPFILFIVGPYFPPPWTVTTIPVTRLIASLSLHIAGIWGPLPQVMMTWVAIFLVFAGFVRGFGGLKAIVGSVVKLLARREVLFPQVAVLSSMLFGTFSGSAIANVAGTGAFTIPMMKERGIKPEHAGAIETVASTGGALMPPIMGAGAFVMAEFTGISYASIMAAGIIPALIFYAIVAGNVHILSSRALRSLKMETTQKTIENVKEIEVDYMLLGSIAVSIIALLYFIAIERLSILKAGIYCTLVFLGLMFIITLLGKGGTKEREVSLKGRVLSFSRCLKNSLDEIVDTVPLLVLIGAGLGIATGVLLTTGILWSLTANILDLTMGNIWLLLLMTLFVSALLGMAISGLATYLLVAPIFVLAYNELGVSALVAHFIVFYASILAPITPPIAPACSVAAKIANASFPHTARSALIIGSPIFLMPIAFVNYPGVLGLDFVSSLTVLVAVGLISAGMMLWSKGRYLLFYLLAIGIGVAMLFVPFDLYLRIPLIILTLGVAIVILLSSTRPGNTLFSAIKSACRQRK